MAINHQSSVLQTNSANPRPEDEILEQLYKEKAEYAAQFHYNLRDIYRDLLKTEESISLPRIDLQQFL